jgi:hypothetical protein
MVLTYSDSKQHTLMTLKTEHFVWQTFLVLLSPYNIPHVRFCKNEMTMQFPEYFRFPKLF